MKISEFPKLGDKDFVNVCFIRKYRQQHVSNYVFLSVELKKDIANILKNWLLENIHIIKDRPLVKYDHSTDESEKLEYIDLNSIEKWSKFKEKAFTLQDEKINNLSEIKKLLVGYMIFAKKDDFIFGQVRKLSSSNVLDRKGIYKLFFDETKFNELREDTGLRVDDKADAIFKIDNNRTDCIVLNKKNFKDIFDMHEEEEREAKAVLSQINMLVDHPYAETIQHIVTQDRTIQKMLLNPTMQASLNEIDFETIKNIKKEIPEEIQFDVDEERKVIVFPDGKESEAIRCFIKLLTNHFNRTINNRHIIESSPKRMVK